MSVSKFTPAELEELRRADAEIDAEDTPLEDELDAKLDIASAAQTRGKTEEQIAAEKAYSRNRYKIPEVKEYHQEYNRKYYAEHKEQQCAKRHQYYLDHKADYRERSHKYTKAHPERARERRRKYAEKVKSDPEKLEAMRRSQKEYRQKHKAEISQRAKEKYRKSKEKESAPSESA